MPLDNPAKRLLTESNMVSEYGFNLYTLRNWRALRQGPPFVKAGRSVLYDRGAVENWLAQRTICTDTPAAPAGR
jgi:hypothetical protein